ncbi:Putative asparagine synthetase [glutamine-hydrolyzing] [Rhodocyclaceae bacterium]|nr:Putative asparagine synthetase [glutamine-hydrolyzing] [Rhodocyclaceae bacterium]
MGLGFKLKQLSYGFGHPVDYQSHQWMAAFSEREQSTLWSSEAVPERPAGGLRDDTMRLTAEMKGLSDPERLQHLFLTGYLAEDILQKVDRASMYNSLEVRAPFLSRRFAEYALALPFRDKLRGQVSKFALKEMASRMLPTSIIKRPKHGFAPPLARLIRTVLRQRMEGLLFDTRSPIEHWFNKSEIRRYWKEHQSARRDHHRKLWTLAILFLIASKA